MSSEVSASCSCSRKTRSCPECVLRVQRRAGSVLICAGGPAGAQEGGGQGLRALGRRQADVALPSGLRAGSDELVWSHLKRTGTAKNPLQKGEQPQDRIEAALLALQRNRPLVRSSFRASSLSYIADC